MPDFTKPPSDYTHEEFDSMISRIAFVWDLMDKGVVLQFSPGMYSKANSAVSLKTTDQTVVTSLLNKAIELGIDAGEWTLFTNPALYGQNIEPRLAAYMLVEGAERNEKMMGN